MTHSPLTDEIRISSQSSSRLGATIDTILYHHLAGTDAERAINDMISGADGGSANYVISNEGKITLVVDEDDRAWSAGSTTDGGKGAAWDRRSISYEIENETAGPEWRISDAALDAAAALTRDIRSRYPIVNELGHRDLYEQYDASYPTYCPGPDTVAEITRRANTPTEEEEIMAAKDDIIAEIQKAAQVVRREARARLYRNTDTGEYLVASIPDGFQIGPWDPKVDTGRLASLVVNGYLIIADQEAERPQSVDQIRFDNIQAEVMKHRKALAQAVIVELQDSGLVIPGDM